VSSLAGLKTGFIGGFPALPALGYIVSSLTGFNSTKALGTFIQNVSATG
jgi:hypothetical protein